MGTEPMISTKGVATLKKSDIHRIDPFWTEPDEQGRTMLHLVATGANDGIWGWDVPTGLSFYSSRWWELIGWSEEGRGAHIDTFYELLHEDDRDRVLEAIGRFIVGKVQDYRMEFRLRHADGGWRWILSLGSALRDASGRATRIAGTHTDITDQMETADRLERLVAERTRDLVVARDRAELAAASTTKFLSATSHDIRQPLQAMALLLGSLQAEALSESGTRTLEGVHRSLISSMELLDDLLEYSRLDAGALRPVIGPVDLRSLLLALEDGFGIEARQRGIRLAVRTTGLVGRSDAQLLGRIIRNLVSNSLKFTSDGTVLIAARSRGSDIRIEVWDSGVGIPPEMQRQVFWEFVQDGRQPVAGSGRGLGLGLAIVERLSRLLGHRMGMRSQPGRGSVFWVEVPKHQTPLGFGRSMPRGSANLPGFPEDCRVALIENDTQISQAFVTLLRSWNCRVVSARTVESLLSQIANEAPDLVIADWHLDSMIDGFEAFDRLEERFGEAMPGVVLTGDNDFERIARINRAGRKVLHKPILPDVLNAVLQAQLHSGGSWKAGRRTPK
jgi:PAS domain S-box-containing protein